MDLQRLKKASKVFQEVEYYFLRLPYASLRRADHAYRKVRAFTARVEEERQKRVSNHFKGVFGDRLSDGEIEAFSRKHFEILGCDDLDAWLWLFNRWEKIKRHVRVEGEENFKEVVKKGKGCILLSAHFGGAFFIFDIVRELGGRPQGFGLPVKREHFGGDFFRWLYIKFRLFCVERAIGEKIILIGRRETAREVLDKLEKGYHVVVFFDVPPQFLKGKIEKVSLLGRDWSFSRGFLKVVAGREIPIVPFFTYLDENHVRTFRFYPPYQIQNRDETNRVFQECVKIFESHLLKTPEQWFFWEGADVFWEDPHSTRGEPDIVIAPMPLEPQTQQSER